MCYYYTHVAPTELRTAPRLEQRLRSKFKRDASEGEPSWSAIKNVGLAVRRKASPYRNAAAILKATPEPGSEFMGWTHADGTPITLSNGVLNADGNDVTVHANFYDPELELATKYAPVLKFDGAASGYGYPMSA